LSCGVNGNGKIKSDEEAKKKERKRIVGKREPL
jgi:hypothetical protein